MKKIAVTNLNVGSAVEYAGDIFIQWLKELGHDVVQYGDQTIATYTIKFLYDYKPDLIVVNEDHHRPIVAVLMYQALRDVPIIYVDHSWNRMTHYVEQKFTREADEIEQMWYRHMLTNSQHIFCLNYKPDHEPWNHRVTGRVSNRFYPTDPRIFNVTQTWASRERMFCYIGNLLPHKLSEDFLAKIRWTNLVIDCYGNNTLASERYLKVFDKAVESGNIKYKGMIEQDKIADVMNKYKYLVLPHDGYEPFNWVLKQCMFCGTIPLVTNDRDSSLYYGKWIDWAQGLYMGTKFTTELLNNMTELNNKRPDHSEESVKISSGAQARFDYDDFKNEFKLKAQELLHG